MTPWASLGFLSVVPEKAILSSASLNILQGYSFQLKKNFRLSQSTKRLKTTSPFRSLYSDPLETETLHSSAQPSINQYGFYDF